MAGTASQLLREGMPKSSSAETVEHDPAAIEHHPADAANGFDATRDSYREPIREAPRYKPREPHEKYQVPESSIPKGMDAIWVATKVMGAKSPRLGEFVRSGWRPARAEDFPEHSDYQLFDQSLIDMGIVPEVKPDGPVILGDQMLVLRPKHHTKRAEIEREEAARKQFDEHMKRVYDRSAREIGPQRTFVRHNYGPNDIVPDDDIDAR